MGYGDFRTGKAAPRPPVPAPAVTLDLTSWKLWSGVAAAIALAAGLLIWRSALRPPEELTEEKALRLAASELGKFCEVEEVFEANQFYLTLRETAQSPDSRFRWAFVYVDDHGDPWHKVLVHVGKFGETNIEYFPETPQPGGYAAPESP